MPAFGLKMPTAAPKMIARHTTTTAYIPNYGIPTPGNYKKRSNTSNGDNDIVAQPPKKQWWTYRSPTASIGSPVGYALKNVGLPAYGGGSGGGGSGGRGGGGGGGGSGDPMKGFTYLFAILLFAGGLYAYLKKGSEKSVLFASGVAILLFISASMMGHPTYRNGTILALATTLGLTGAMGYRAKESGKLMPAGVVAALSALMSAGYIASLV